MPTGLIFLFTISFLGGVCIYILVRQRILSLVKTISIIKLENVELLKIKEVYLAQTNELNGVTQEKIRLEERLHPLEKVQERAAHLQEEIMMLRQKNVELVTTIQKERDGYEEKLLLLKDAKSSLLDTFKSLSHDALKSNNDSFLALAQETLSKFQDNAKYDLSSRQQAINELITPLKEALTNVDQKIHFMEKGRASAFSGLQQQLTDMVAAYKNLEKQTNNLVYALKTPTVRGRWGEMQLKRVVEMAGMLAYCDFVEQVQTHKEEERLRPDMVIRLPGKKQIIVDAKAPLSSYLEALESFEEHKRLECLQRHAKQVRQHIVNLSRRSYWAQFQSSPDFVIMFLPGEVFFSAALEHDPQLIEAGVAEKVILATPTTLIALLRTISLGWQQENLAENARYIGNLGRELYKRLHDMTQHMLKLGKNLGAAVDSYNRTIGAFEHRVLVSARKFNDLDGGHPSLTLPPLESINSIPKEPRQAEPIDTLQPKQMPLQKG